MKTRINHELLNDFYKIATSLLSVLNDVGLEIDSEAPTSMYPPVLL